MPRKPPSSQQLHLVADRPEDSTPPVPPVPKGQHRQRIEKPEAVGNVPYLLEVTKDKIFYEWRRGVPVRKIAFRYQIRVDEVTLIAREHLEAVLAHAAERRAA